MPNHIVITLSVFRVQKRRFTLVIRISYTDDGHRSASFLNTVSLVRLIFFIFRKFARTLGPCMIIMIVN